MRNSKDPGMSLLKCVAVAVIVGLTLNVAAATARHFVVQQSEKTNPPKTSAPQQPEKSTHPEAITPPSQNCEDVEQLRANLQRLRAQVQQLRKKVIEIEKDRQVNVLRDVLSREEQRGETLQARLRETLERQIALQARLQQVDQEIRPENIERMFVGVGMVRPEEARESVRRRLSVEKQGILAQLEMLRQERARLQASLATTDAAIQRLRARISEAARP